MEGDEELFGAFTFDVKIMSAEQKRCCSERVDEPEVYLFADVSGNVVDPEQDEHDVERGVNDHVTLQKFFVLDDDVKVDGKRDDKDKCGDKEPRKPRLGNSYKEPNDRAERGRTECNDDMKFQRLGELDL